uniref:Uncharacterized protein n=1 Tax=Oryza brachyantha TaxID=4533 RepID=J3M477_ORYBR
MIEHDIEVVISTNHGSSSCGLLSLMRLAKLQKNSYAFHPIWQIELANHRVMDAIVRLEHSTTWRSAREAATASARARARPPSPA